ncbi:hypothetical protein BJ878DRAFT_517192 [Calycina marina]|uniref:Transmembrane protein n=1 Tax=Calycina marina TaxID=1763456 RepID=A0A9P7YYP9_9HELO|nr:hypothetical protein BJ878DRAFT_517192 [Calycina marina]
MMIWARHSIPLKQTKGGDVFSVIISLTAMAALAVCLARRLQDIREWRKLPLVCWLVLLIYTDSIIFVFSTAIISQGLRVNSSRETCSKAVLLCLGCYMTTKILIYYFLIERAYAIRKTTKPRLKSKLYLFNSLAMLIPYCIVIVLNFYFRFAIYYDDGSCKIGMKKVSMIPLVAFDILINVYLTSLFIIPLRNLYSYKTNPSSQLRTIVLRTFVGSCATLVSSVVNLTVMMVLGGEPGWICLLCCNLDIFFSVLVLHWLTSKDKVSLDSSNAACVRQPSSYRPVLLPRTEHDFYPYSLPLDQAQGGITTFVTVGRGCSISEVDRNFEEAGPELKFPTNAITVSREMVRAVDRISGEREQTDHGVGREDELLGPKKSERQGKV